MRICITTCDPVNQLGGMEWSIQRIAAMLADSGWQVDIVQLELNELAFEWASDIPGVDDLGEMGTGIRLWIVRRLYGGNHGYRQLAVALERLHRMRNYAIFHGFFLGSAGYITSMVARQFSKPVIVSVRGSDINRDIYSSDQLPRILWTLSNANLVTFVNHPLVEIADALQPCRERSVVILNSTGDEYFQSHLVALLPRPDGFLIGGLGILSYKKNWRELFHVWIRLKEKGIPVSLRWIGTVASAEKNEIFSFIEKHGLQDNFSITGEVPHQAVLDFLRQLDVFVSLAIDEGCPNAVLEAMLAGIPTVAYGAGSIPDLIRHQQDGLVYTPCETKELVQGVHQLWENRELARCMGTNARHRVMEVFTPEIEQAGWVSCYHRLLAP